MQGLLPISEEETRSILRRAIDFLFGYDYFISYAWVDGRDYAVALARELAAMGFECFLDSKDYAKGDNWRLAGRRAIRKTARLILVGSPGALVSEPVLRELDAFERTGRRVVPISFDGSLFPAERTAPIFQHLLPETLAIREALHQLAGGPSLEALQELRAGFELQRQDRKRIRWLVSAAVVLAVLLAASVVASWGFVRQLAKTQRNLAVAMSNEASRMIQDRRWLAAHALMATASQYPSTFETRIAILSSRPSRLELAGHTDLGLTGPDWLATSVSGRLIAGGTQSGQVLFVLPNGLLVWPNLNSAREGQVAFAPDEGSLWFAAEEEGLFEVSIANTKRHLSSPDRPGRVLFDPLTKDLLIGQEGVGLGLLSLTKGDSGSELAEMLFNEAAVSSDGMVLAATDYALQLHVWKGEHRGISRTIDLIAMAGRKDVQPGLLHPPLAVSPDGSRVGAVVDFNDSSTLLLFDVESEQLIHRTTMPPVDVVGERPLQFSADGSFLLLQHQQGLSAFWARSGEVAWPAAVRRSRRPSSVAVDPLGRFIAAAFSSELIELLDPADGSVLEAVDAHREAVQALTFSPDGSLLLSAGLDGVLRRWRVKSSRFMRYVFKERAYVHIAAVGTGGRIAVGTWFAGGFLVVVVDTRDPDLEAHPAMLSESRVTHLSWSQDGGVLLAVTLTGKLLVWREGQAEISTRPADAFDKPPLAVLPRSGGRGFIALHDKRLTLHGPMGERENTMTFLKPWAVPWNGYPLAVDEGRFAFLASDEEGSRIVEWSRVRGWSISPLLSEEPAYFFQKKGRTFLVGPMAIRSWQPGEREMRFEANLASQLGHGGPAVLLAAGSILVRPGETVRTPFAGQLQLELEVFDLTTGRRELLTEPLRGELAEDSENFILYLGEGGSPGTLLTLCRSGLLNEWGATVGLDGKTVEEATGLHVEGTAVRVVN